MQSDQSAGPGGRGLRPDAVIAICIGAALVICNIIRIVRVPMTCDESPGRADLLLTYGQYVRLDKVSANIHILNSILRKASIEAFGNTPFFLRLPNLLAQILFLVFCYRLLCRLFREGGWRIAVFLACTLHPFLFEFWGYSRGYGLAMGFMAMSLYYLIEYMARRRTVHIWLCLLAAAAAAWSNFALLNYFVALCGVLSLQAFYREERPDFFRRTLPAMIVVPLMLFLLVAGPVSKLRASGELYYGGETSVVEDTINSLVRENIHNPEEGMVRDVTFVVVCLLVLTIVYWAVALFRGRKDRADRRGVALGFLIALIMLSLTVQHLLLGTRYLIDRTALFIVVLMVLPVCYTLYVLPGRAQIAGKIVMLVIAVLVTGNFLYRIDLRSSRSWYLDNRNADVLAYLSARHRPGAPPLKLRVSWIQMPSMDYYIYTKYPAQFEPLEYVKEGPGAADTAYDYCYLPDADAKNLSPVYVKDSVFDASTLYRKRGSYPAGVAF